MGTGRYGETLLLWCLTRYCDIEDKFAEDASRKATVNLQVRTEKIHISSAVNVKGNEPNAGLIHPFRRKWTAQVQLPPL